MSITVRAMTIFARVVETNNFAAAARRLLIDPAAVSRAIKALEEELNVLLFARSTRALRLTADGERFYHDCVSILGQLDQATNQFRAQAKVLRGQLRIGLGPMLTRRLVVRTLPAFQRRYPEIEILLLAVNEVAELADGGIDVLIRTRTFRQHGGHHKESQGLVQRKLIQSRLIVCASPDYLDRNGTPRHPSELLNHACIALVTVERDVQSEWQFVRSNQRHKVRFVPKLLAQGEALREAGVAGCGLIRLSACHVEDELRSGRLVAVLTDWECTGAPPILAFYRKAKPTLPLVRALVEHLAAELRPYNIGPKS